MPADMIDDDTAFAEKQDLGLLKHKRSFRWRATGSSHYYFSIAYSFSGLQSYYLIEMAVNSL